MKNNCQFCGNEFETEELYAGYLSMTMPNPEMENKKEKWGQEFWKHLERTDLTETEAEELDQLSFYDQMLNTVGRGFACQPCLEQEDKLLNEYYPQPNEIN